MTDLAWGSCTVTGDGDGEDEDTGPSEVYLSMVCHRGQLGVAYYDTADYSVHYMPDTQDDFNLKLLDKVIEEVQPLCIISSAKQDRNVSERLKKLSSTQDKPEVVLYPSADFGIEISKQRVLSAHLPFVPAGLTEAERITYLSSLLPFDCLQMMCAVGGLLRFMERRRVGVELEDSSVRVPILAFKQFLLNNLVYIDHDTYCVLQIFKAEPHPSIYKLASGVKEGMSLYGILNRCKSKFGSRLMRRWFLRPTRDLAVLNMRQEVIEFFTSPRNNQVLTTLQDCLKNIKGIPAMLRRMTLSNTKVSDWQALYKISYNAVCIRDTVSSLPQSVQLFREISQAFSEDLHYISSLISKVVDFELSIAEKHFTIKPNVDPAIDEKKRKMMGLSDFLTDVARKELDNLDSQIPSCSVIYIPLIGFLLSVPRIPSMDENKDFEIEGLDFMFLSEDRLHYRSQRTKELDTMLGDLHCEIRDLETAVMTQLQEKVVEKGPVLYQVMEYSAQLDCLISLALASREFSYCRPTLSTEHSISIRDCRHPLVEMCTGMYVSNPVLSSADEGKMKVITGPNSCGKSVYLKQVGLAVFMALVGSNVPASEAHIGLVDGIYTRMQSRESVSVGLSTFMIDLNQMACAVNNATERSLVLIDEFGKGTNTVDGLSLLASSLRHWLHPGQACPHVFISTNFHSLFQLNLLPESPLLSYQTLETAVDGEELVFFYQLREGVSTSSYAANIATLAGMPAKIVQRGVEVSELYRAGKCIKRLDQSTSQEQFDRCKELVNRFLRLDLEDLSVDLQEFMRTEVLFAAASVL
ncbi:mutS protein homolog 5-like [Acipenser ruthenus]|uniref:mutS protein homolog 5-like n=1 Tax=Acipenser ruthenus TaxID=7906 RepID=UPI002740957F|nr:mutS protein homolog 5-like [Acipenser ruthenus]